MKIKHHTVRLVAGSFLLLACLLGVPFGLHVADAQPTWNFEGGATHGFTLLTVNPATPAADDPTIAGDESLTGAGGGNGLPGAGLAWMIGPPNQFNGLKPVVLEGNHTNASGLLDYTLNAQPIPAGPNARGQTNYLNTYSLNQWGDNLNTTNNDQIARSPNVVVGSNAVMLVWSYGGGSGAGVQAPVVDGTGYTAGSSGIAVRSASDNSLLASARIDGQGALKMHSVPLTGLAGQTVYVDVVDAFQGSFGWLAVDEILFTNNTINLDADSFTFEAEDFNFSNGQFIDNPLVTNAVAANCYYQKGSVLGTGLEGVDFHEVNSGFHFGVENVEWRYVGFAGAFENLPQTTNSFDALRTQYVAAAVADFDLATNVIGEWCNYTRTFPATNAHLYARVASVGPFKIQVDMVSNPTVSNQTLTTRGWFIGNGSGSAALYQTVPLTDSSGSNLLAVAFNGTPKTLRMTSQSAGYAVNFYALDPTNAPEYFVPFVSVTNPPNFSLHASGAALTINAAVSDLDSPPGSHTVKFYVDNVEVGQDMTAPYSFTTSPLANGPHKLKASVVDPNGLVATSTDVLVQVGPEPYLYRETFGIPDGLSGDKSPNVFGWQPFGASGNARPETWINYAATNKTFTSVNSFSAGAHFDGNFDPCFHGVHYTSDAANETNSLTFTPEFSFNPGDYPQVKFSWEQGNQSSNATFRLIIRIGSTWYAHATAFKQTNDVNPIATFAIRAELKEVIYNPDPTNWFLLNFDGTYDHTNKISVSSTLGALALGANPGAPLSGTINAFGLLGANSINNRRFDTFTIQVTPPQIVITNSFLSGGLLSLQGTGGSSGAGYRVLSATDITLPIGSWSQSATGTFTTGGAFSNAVPVNLSEPARYHRIVTP